VTADERPSDGPPESGRRSSELPPEGDRKRPALLYVQKLSKVYPVSRGFLRSPALLHALDGVSFYVRRRETFGLVGESGSGKSTLGRCVLRLVEPTVGRVVFDGKDITALGAAELRTMRRRMQIVFQDPYGSLDPNMTTGEIVREGIDVFDLAKSRAEGHELAVSMLERVGLGADLAGRYPHELSGGQRQRVAIARALAVRPDFVVLDEPTSSLDLSVQAQILNLLDDLQEELGLSQLFISHDLRVVQYVSHRIAVMYFGRIVEVGPTDAVTRRRYHPYTRALFAAMPRADDAVPSKRRLQVVPEGEAPSPLDPPRGCAFFGRCPSAEPGQCDTHAPALSELVDGSHHRVACWHPNVD
jgi:peptide/nickel transport system ATP-binding protein